MARRKYAHQKLAKPPGFLLYTGEYPDEDFTLELSSVHNGELAERSLNSVDDIQDIPQMKGFKWLNVSGLSNVDEIGKLSEFFALHPLVQEDIVNVGARPKFDEFDKYLFIVLKMMYYKDNQLVVEHVSFVLMDNLVISFQEVKDDVFNGVRERLRIGKGRIRMAGADYLLYTLIDAVVDHYFVVFENYGDRIEELENEIFEDPDESISAQIQHMKRQVFRIRRALFPMREVVNRLERSESPLILEETRPFIRDVHNHNVQLIETVENYRDMTMGLMDLYMTGISHKMNTVMKVLTIISTIFIPLTFIAGIYGMNFEYIPELGYRNAYFILWGVMVAMFLVMLYLFKRKKWL